MVNKLINRRQFTSLSIQQPSAEPSIDIQCRDLFANYFISDDVIGSGTTAVVKLGVRKSSGAVAAIKEIKTYGDEELFDAVAQEFDLMKHLKHPNIIKVHDLYMSSRINKAYLCMDFVNGWTLKGAVEAHGKIVETTMQPLFQQLASAVSYIHRQKIIHRDLKPDNLLLDKSMENLYVCDFNYSRKLADGVCLTSRISATTFAAPEILLGQSALGEQADVWSIGVCLYYALSGGFTPTSRKACYRKAIVDDASFGKYLAEATSTERFEWMKSAGLSKESLVAQFLHTCLNPDPCQRPDVFQLLAHPWVSPAEDAPNATDDGLPEEHNHRSSSWGMSGKPSKKLSDEGNMALRAHRLCLSGFDGCESVLGQSQQMLDGEEDDSTVASEADVSPRLHPTVMLGSIYHKFYMSTDQRYRDEFDELESRLFPDGF